MKKTLMISLNDLTELPCRKYLEYIKNTYGDGQFNVFDVFEKMNAKASDVNWLFTNCPIAQTEEMIKYFKSLNPTAWDVRWLITYCSYAQTEEMLEYFKSLNPTVSEVLWLIADCSFAQINKDLILQQLN